MIRGLALTGLLASAVLAGGCTWRMSPPEEASPIGSLERAERARTDAARMHPDCRDERADRKDQSEACREVARRDR